VARLNWVCLSGVLVAFVILPAAAYGNVLHTISFVTDHPQFDIVLIQTKSPIPSYRFTETSVSGRAIYVDLPRVSPGAQRQEIDVNSGTIRRARVEYNRSRQATRVLIDLQPGVPTGGIVHRKLEGKQAGQLIVLIDLPRGQARTMPTEVEAKRLREEGKRIVIIDPGHGWLDSGCEANGMQEKTICLDIGRKLAALINKTDNMRAYLTRDGDYLPVMNKEDYSGTWNQIKSKSLTARLEFARRMRGQAFVSLHLNWARRKGARGFEIYYLGPENSQAVYQDQVNEVDPADLLAFDADLPESGLDVEASKLLLSMKRDITTQYNDIFVEDLKNQLVKVPDLVPRELPIKPHGRLRVLQTLAMPSALVEMAFLSNQEDAALLRKTDFRWKLAKALYQGIAEFFEQRSNGELYERAFQATRVSIPDERYDIHIVQKDETLFGIAQRYGTDAATLQRINGKGRSTAIFPGEEVKVPRPTSQVHAAQAGDNAREIAPRSAGSRTTPKRVSQPNTNKINSSQNVAGPSRTSVQAGRDSAQRIVTYRVRQGDSLYEIARRFRTTVYRLKTLNGLTSNIIRPGQKLHIPLR